MSDREILFRGKRKDNGEWVYGDLLRKKDVFDEIRTRIFEIKGSGFFAKEEVVSETVGQYTGLTDKNGTKIFEGDIINARGVVGQIIYDADETEYGILYEENDYYALGGCFYPKDGKVIGNIYDNPELLEGERAGMNKPIIDVCCGSKMFWFDKNNPNVVFCDKREVPYHEYYPGRYIEIKPDVVCDFTDLPFEDNAFKLVVFDPPHLSRVGETSWLAQKYGRLDKNWPQMIHDGFHECMRVLDEYGVLIFKWSEVQIPLKEVLKAIKSEPLFGHKSGKHNNTHWLCFMKFGESEQG